MCGPTVVLFFRWSDPPPGFSATLMPSTLMPLLLLLWSSGALGSFEPAHPILGHEAPPVMRKSRGQQVAPTNT